MPTSTPRLLTVARDLRRRRGRQRTGLFVAEGIRTVEELLRSPLTVRGLLTAASADTSPRAAALVEQALHRHIAVQPVDDAAFASASDTEAPQGVLALAEMPRFELESLSSAVPMPPLVVLDAVQDPGNVGTILRTAAALGALGVVALPGTVDLWNAKVVRSAMGASFSLPAVSTTIDRLVAFLGERGVPLWGADAGGEAVFSTPATGVAIAVGNEGAGLGPEVQRMAARLVCIPIMAGVESLNVAVATGILLHQLRA